MSNAVFTIGSSTEQKMDMSLDSIIKQNKTKKTPRGTVKGGGQKPAPKNAAVQRRQQMAAQARNRAVANRGNKVDKMRGVQTTAKPQTFKVKVSTRDSNWMVQQKQRDQERKKKLQIYKKTATTGSTTSGSNKTTNAKNVNDLSSFKISVPNPAFHFEAPTQSNNTNNRNNQGGNKNKGNRGGNKGNGVNNNGSIRISTGGSGRKAVVANHPERERDLPQRTVQFKGRKNEAVAKRRGIEATAESKQPASLSDRFGSVQTPQRESNTTRGRGGRGRGRGNGRGANRGASGGRGGRDANIRIVRRT